MAIEGQVTEQPEGTTEGPPTDAPTEVADPAAAPADEGSAQYARKLANMGRQMTNANQALSNAAAERDTLMEKVRVLEEGNGRFKGAGRSQAYLDATGMDRRDLAMELMDDERHQSTAQPTPRPAIDDTELDRRLDAREKVREESKAAKRQEATNAFVATVSQEFNDSIESYPLVHHWGASPEEMVAMTKELMRQTGRMPEPTAVLQRLEQVIEDRIKRSPAARAKGATPPTRLGGYPPQVSSAMRTGSSNRPPPVQTTVEQRSQLREDDFEREIERLNTLPRVG